MNYEPTQAEITGEAWRLAKKDCLEFGKSLLKGLIFCYAMPTMLRTMASEHSRQGNELARASGFLTGAISSVTALVYQVNLVYQLSPGERADRLLLGATIPIATNILSAGYEGIRALYQHAKDNLKQEKPTSLENRVK